MNPITQGRQIHERIESGDLRCDCPHCKPLVGGGQGRPDWRDDDVVNWCAVISVLCVVACFIAFGALAWEWLK